MKRDITIFDLKGRWSEVRDECMLTANKEMTGKDPSDEWKLKLLISEHSPIRSLWIRWIWPNIPHWVGVHFVRHIWPCMVATQRTDRTGVIRDKLPQDEPQKFYGEANPQHLIDTSRKRLCRQASTETREYWESLKTGLMISQPEIGAVMVPNCVYRGGCPELLQHPGSTCIWYQRMVEHNPDFASTDIRVRYQAYNDYYAYIHTPGESYNAEQ